MSARGAERAFGALLILLLVVHAYGKSQAGIVSEMISMCHVATALVALGLIGARHELVALGGFFHLCILPFYVLDAIAAGTTTLTSVLLHVLTPAAGWRELRRRGEVPGWLLWATVGLYLLLLPATTLFTDPALNVNLVYAPWPLVAGFVHGRAMTIAGNVVAMSVVLWLARSGARRLLKRTA